MEVRCTNYIPYTNYQTTWQLPCPEFDGTTNRTICPENLALLPAQYGNTVRRYISQPWAIVHPKSIMHRHARLQYAEYEPWKP